MPTCTQLAAAGLMALAAAAATAEIVTITWGTGGRFERTLQLAPGAVAEVCGALEPGQRVRWSFDADPALDFNVHHHVGSQVVYAVQKTAQRSARDTLAPNSAQDYCWMWKNRSAAPAVLKLQLQR